MVAEYQAQSYTLTLRQLYYQVVSRAIIANRQTEYKRLGELLNNARLGGWVDWDAIEDRGRQPRRPLEWDSPRAVLETAAGMFRLDRWRGQPFHVEVWVEKDALAGVLQPVANRYHVTFMANSGYSSATAMYEAGKRCSNAAKGKGKKPVIIYLGDHDPSGLDMTRDIRDRLGLLSGIDLEVERVALNYDQVEEYNPPPNPAKLTDSRVGGYLVEFGNESWELDALEPAVLDRLVSSTIEGYLDQELYRERVREEDQHRETILAFGNTLDDSQP